MAVTRAQRIETLLRKDKFPRNVKPTVQDAFQLATCHAAHAIGLENDIGKLKVGFKADIVTMVCAAAEDPLAALVCHAGTSDVDFVIVDGAICKRASKLCDYTMQGPTQELLRTSSLLGGDASDRNDRDGNLSWTRVARALEQSRSEI
ncbi:hypothetical protein N0V90_007910 [Kalmusia sp. IMI 367209]|nr:hypothetical protein N0V90_007910 [Kalmusia sp. IMI 367209]